MVQATRSTQASQTRAATSQGAQSTREKKTKAPRAESRPTERQLRQEIKKAATDLLNAASGEAKTEKDYARVKLSEDQVVATVVLRRAEKRNLPLAEKIQKEFQSYLNQAQGIGSPDPYTAATVALLSDARKGGLMTEREQEGYMAIALGKAQLDRNEGTINDSSTSQIVGKEGRAVKNNLDSVVSRVRSNSITSREFASLTMEKIRLDTEIRTMQKAQDDLQKITPVTTPGTGSTTPIKDSEEVVAGELPDASTLPTERTDFVYKPRCMQDGNALIQLPIRFSHFVNSVKLYDSETNRTYDLTFKGYDKDDGRAHWKLDREGLNLGKSVSIVLGMIDGGSEEFNIGDSDRYFKYGIR